MMPLDLLTPGDRAEIIAVRHCGGCGCNHRHGQGTTRAEEMGLRVGTTIEMIKNDSNLILVLVEQSRIAIDRRMARGISVKGVQS